MSKKAEGKELAALERRKQHLMGVVSKINADNKKIVITTADQALNPYIVRRPTGVMSIDVRLKGGFPPGVTYLSGPDNVGKSHLLYRAMAMHQRIYGARSRIALASVETALDHFFLRFMGVMIAVPDEVIEQHNEARIEQGKPPFTKEEVKELKYQVGDFLPIAGTMEEVLDTVLTLVSDEQLRRKEDQFGILGIDSFTSLAPADTVGKDMDENLKRAAHASRTTEFYNKLAPKLTSLDGDPIYTSFIFTQQVRANPAKATAPAHIAKYLPEFATAGAWSAKHAKCLDLMITTGAREKDKKAENPKDVVSKILKWQVAKGKAGVHDGITGEIELDFRVPTFIDEAADIISEGVRCGLMKEISLGKGKKPNLSYRDSTSKEFGEPSAYDELHHALQADVDFEMSVRRAILTANDVSCRYVP
jgi:RecA/RadA recombinase